MNDDIKEELRAAVLDGDLQQVKALLAAGADINARLGIYEDTLLHLAHTVDVVQELLFHEPNVNARNNYGWAPLHCAVEFRKGVAVMGEVLRHEVDVNARPNETETVLFVAVFTCYNDLEIVKRLLDCGADINITCLEHSSEDDHYCTPLDMCVVEGDLQCSKLFIKITLLKNFNEDYKKLISLDSYVGYEIHQELTGYLEDCVREIRNMRTYKVNDKYSLYHFVKRKKGCIKPLYATVDIDEEEILANYPIYQDVILPRIEQCQERANLFDQIPGLLMSAFSQISGSNCEKRSIILNADCKYKIAEYLSNNDLSNLVRAFEKNLF